jgi:hypothetical protein
MEFPQNSILFLQVGDAGALMLVTHPANIMASI